MRIFILEHGPAIVAAVLGGLAGGFAGLAYFRGRAVDRLVRVLELREMMLEIQHDAPGRVIARSVERMTKETR
jgi:hypothetical protein